MRTDGKNRRAFLVITPKGIICAACAALFLILGIMRGELSSALCGAILAGFLVFSFLTTAVASAWRRSIRLSISWEPDKTKGIRVRWGTPRGKGRRMTLARVFCAIHYETQTGQSFDLEVPLTGNTILWKPELPARGVYLAESPFVIVRDYPDFFRFRLSPADAETPETLVICPVPEPAESITWPAGKTGMIRGKSMFKRSEELFDSRPYHTGDDPRKINWKQYAHTAALSVKQGDLLPPPSSEFLFIVNTLYEGNITDLERASFSRLMNRLAWTMLRLLGDNKIVSLTFAEPDGKSGRTTVFPDDLAGRQKMLNALAYPLLIPDSGNGMPVQHDTAGITTVFVTLPPERISGKASSARTDCDLILIGPRESGAKTLSLVRFIRMLLLTTERFSVTSKGIEEERRLADFLAALRSEGIHAETI